MKPSRKPNQLSAFAVTAPGLESICAAELAALEISDTPEDGGVAWTGTLESVARANLWLRTASRVIVRLAEFQATAFFELELQAKQIPWKRFVVAGERVEFRVTCRKSKLYHSDAVAQRFAEAVTRQVPAFASSTGKESDDDIGDGVGAAAVHRSVRARRVHGEHRQFGAAAAPARVSSADREGAAARDVGGGDSAWRRLAWATCRSTIRCAAPEPFRSRPR